MTPPPRGLMPPQLYQVCLKVCMLIYVHVVLVGQACVQCFCGVCSVVWGVLWSACLAHWRFL